MVFHPLEGISCCKCNEESVVPAVDGMPNCVTDIGRDLWSNPASSGRWKLFLSKFYVLLFGEDGVTMHYVHMLFWESISSVKASSVSEVFQLCLAGAGASVCDTR